MIRDIPGRSSVALAGALAALAMSTASVAFGQVPSTIGYQGVLMDDGAPAAGAHTLAFAIFDAQTGGTNLWPGTGAESHAVTVSSTGAYAVDLGSVDPLGDTLFLSAHAGQGVIPSYYLELSVDGTTLAPRQLLESVPFAAIAGSVNDPNGTVITGTAFASSSVIGTATDAGGVAQLWVNGEQSNTPALFGSSAGIGLVEAFPGVAFNGYFNNAWFAQTGSTNGWNWMEWVSMDPNGNLVFYSAPTATTDYTVNGYGGAGSPMLTVDPSGDLDVSGTLAVGTTSPPAGVATFYVGPAQGTNSTAFFGSGAGIGLAENWPSIGFNAYASNGWHSSASSVDGWNESGWLQMDPLGTFTIYEAPTPATEHQPVGASTPALFTLDNSGNLTIPGTLTAHSKSFAMPDPEDATKQLIYVSLEGGENGTYWRGTAQLHGGRAHVALPHHFGLTTSSEGLTVQVTPSIECQGWVAVGHKDASAFEAVERGGTDDCSFDYLVQGVRRGLEHHQVIQPAPVVSR